MARLNERTIWRWIKAGKIPATKLDHRTFVEYDDIFRLVDENAFRRFKPRRPA